MSHAAYSSPDATPGWRYDVMRPAGPSGGLTAWDDLPVHQSAAPLSVLLPPQEDWAERFYFNVLSATGEILAIIGGGIYPVRGGSESYFCRLDGDVQENVRSWRPLPAADGRDSSEPGPIAFGCEKPLADWTVAASGSGTAFEATFVGTTPPYLYSAIEIPPTEPDGPFDDFRHFVALGRWDVRRDGLGRGGEALVGVRDRTWGVRSRRVRWHNWYVLQLGERCLTLIHQELADGTVMFSEAGVVHADGQRELLRIVTHHVTFDPHTREVIRGSVTFDSEAGPLSLEFEAVGRAMRLAGAGYDDAQGARGGSAQTQADRYDLGDTEIARRTGRGTMDVGVRVHVTGAWTEEGIGVVESAIARNHVRHGHQLAS
jgi:hypothetical protein